MPPRHAADPRGKRAVVTPRRGPRGPKPRRRRFAAFTTGGTRAGRVQDPPGDTDALGFDNLAAALRTLASPTRLQLLSQLRLPAPPRAIRVNASQHHEGQSPNRPVALQVVLRHLAQLVAHDMVREEGSNGTRHYVLNRARLYALTEELRQLTTLSTWHLVAEDGTVDALRAPAPPRLHGPRLVLVHGAYEGRPYALTPDTAVDDTWTIGRSESATVCLDYDLFVSRDHATIKDGPHGFEIVDQGTSRNGTLVNWRAAKPGTAHRLTAGDVIGVGRSMLVCAGM